jgi:hypothetical protein
MLKAMRIRKIISTCTSLALLLAITSCEKTETRPELTIPDSYDGSTFSSYAAQEIALVNNLNNLMAVLNSGNTGEVINVRDLALAFSTNSPSVKSATNTYFASLLEGTNGYFDRLSKASGKAYIPAGPPQGSGGVYGGYVFDSTGIEPAALIGRGLLGAALYRTALNLYIQNPNINNPATADQLLATYGANPSFPNSPTAPRADQAVAALAARYDKNDGNGLYSKIKQNFIKLQAAYEAGEGYNQQRDQAFSDILTLWEKAQAAAAIHACHEVVRLMSAPSPTATDKANALHRYSECIGFLLGYKTISNKTITDTRLDELLALLNFQPQGPKAAYKLITEPARELANVLEVLARLKETYRFSDQEIEDLKKDWVAEQGR